MFEITGDTTVINTRRGGGRSLQRTRLRRISLINRDLQGKFSILAKILDFCPCSRSKFNELQGNSLRMGTANFSSGTGNAMPLSGNDQILKMTRPSQPRDGDGNTGLCDDRLQGHCANCRFHSSFSDLRTTSLIGSVRYSMTVRWPASTRTSTGMPGTTVSF